jgi:hypothetical protein
VTSENAESGDETVKPSFHKLPEDPAEFDKAIAPHRTLVRPILLGISRLATTVGTAPLDKEEIDSGTIAFAALMYQYGAMLDARVLVTLWLASVSIPRAMEYAENRRKADEKAKHANDAKPLPPSLSRPEIANPT